MKERDGRGGKRHQKVKEEHINYMIDTIENDPLLTLKELTDQLYSKFNLPLSKTTVSRHLDLQLYTLKGIRRVSETANSPANKTKRKDYVLKIQKLTSEQKKYFSQTKQITTFIVAG